MPPAHAGQEGCGHFPGNPGMLDVRAMSSESMTIALGSDHAGYHMKNMLARTLADAGYTVHDLGTHSAERVDYPDFAHEVCRDVESGAARFGILVCGSGIGMSIAANRHPGIRCVHASEPVTASLGRAHNNGNVLALGGRLLGDDLALAIVRAFLSGTYEGGRHDGRLAKLTPKAGTPR